MTLDEALAQIRAGAGGEEPWLALHAHFTPQVRATLYLLGVFDARRREELCARAFVHFARTAPWRGDWSSLPGAPAIARALRAAAHEVWRAAASEKTDRVRGLTPADGTPPVFYAVGRN
ncbi:MAG TPA: hypothetical protein VF824_15720 [Thermoanaerobaculia bacterium]